MQFIRSAQHVGFSLSEIARILRVRADGHKPCAEVHEELRVHLQAVRRQLTQLQALEAELAPGERRGGAQVGTLSGVTAADSSSAVSSR